MKINGRQFTKPYEVLCVLPRDGEEDIVFKAQAVLDYSEFEAMCPVPEPPSIQKHGQKKSVPDFQDKKYLEKLEKYNEQRFVWVAMKSLSITPGLEWSFLDPSDPDTWHDIEREFKSAYLSDAEGSLILSKVLEANSLDQTKLDEARQRFLAGQAEEEAGQEE